MHNRVVIKIFSYRSAQRYAVKRTVTAALSVIRDDNPNLKVDILEIRDHQEILQHTPILILPCLMINDQMVCVGRFPAREEVIIWLRAAIPGTAPAAPAKDTE